MTPNTKQRESQIQKLREKGLPVDNMCRLSIPQTFDSIDLSAIDVEQAIQYALAQAYKKGIHEGGQRVKISMRELLEI